MGNLHFSRTISSATSTSATAPSPEIRLLLSTY